MLINFGWIRQGEVAGMGYPGSDAWPELGKRGVRAVLALTERPPSGDPAANDIVVAHVPLADFGTPTQELLRTCVSFIDEQLADGRPVAVHCMAGQGRTGTVLAAWLVAQGLPADEAVAQIRGLRPGSIETRGQLEAVARFGVERT